MSRSLESLQLKHTNVSQPRLERTFSERSLTASEDYYSLSSGSSNRSDSRASQSHPRPPSRSQARTIREVEAPPARYQAPRHSYEGIARPVSIRQVEPRTTPMRGTGRRRRDNLATMEFPVPPSRSERRGSPIRRKPVPSAVYESSPSVEPIRIPPTALSSAAQQMARQSDPPTPEADDTPYVRFALDQITRDEDEAEGKTYLGPEMQQGPEEGPLSPDKEAPAIPYDEIIPIPPRSPRRSFGPTPPPLSPARRYTALLMPFEPPTESFHSPLTGLPKILRPLRFGIFILLLTLYLIALLFTAIWSRVHTGLWDYGSLGDGRYFVFQYLPTLLGMILLLWLFEIEKAVYRVAPFIALASDSQKSRSHGALLPFIPSGFVIPAFDHFRAGQPVFGLFLLASWLFLFTIPLLASSFNVYFRGRWVWLATQGAIWTTIALYLILIAACIMLLLHLHRRRTGLKWDARTLADLIVIIEQSNIIEDIADSGLNSNKSEFLEQSAQRQDRLGYWNLSVRPNDVFHTLGAPSRPARPYSTDEQRLREKSTAQPTGYSNVYIDPESGRPYSYGSEGTHNTTDLVLPNSSNADGHLPWFLRTTFVLLWVITAIVLLLAFLIVSYLPQTSILDGFVPNVLVPVNSFGFSASNFLYSFIPALLGLLCLLFWQNIDLAFRRLQPYASLSSAGGCLAEECLLLSYPSDAPFAVSLKALVNGHIRVALISFVTIIAALLPILAGGVFWSQFYISQQQVRVSAHTTAFYPLTVFLVLYALAYTLAFAGHRRSLPNRGVSLADIIALLHQSRLLNDPAFRSPATKTALVTRLLSAPVSERLGLLETGAAGTTGSKVSLADSMRGFGRARTEARTEAGGDDAEVPRYGYGKYFGRDGKHHIGIDRVGRPSIPDMVIRL